MTQEQVERLAAFQRVLLEQRIDAATTAIDNGWCPIDGSKLTDQEDTDENGTHRYAFCDGPSAQHKCHIWRYDQGGEILDRQRVAEELETFG